MPSPRDFEGTILGIVTRAITDWLARVRTAVFGAGRLYPDPSAVQNEAPAWADLIDSQLIPALEQVAAAGWEDTSGQGYISTNGFVLAQLAMTRNLLVRMPDDVYNLIFEQITIGQTNGETREQIADRIDSVLFWTGSEYWPNRAKVIAVTECLPGDAIVDAAGVTTAYRRFYEGDWLEITTQAGDVFTGTPNHPVLTTQGWIGLGFLQEGDNLICDHAFRKEATMTLNPDVEAQPATIEQVFHALSAVGFIGGIGAGKPDFHGDGMEGYVDVACPDSPLSYGTFHPIIQGSLEGILKGPDLEQVLLAAERAPFTRRLGTSDLMRLHEGPHGLTGRLYDPSHGVSGAFEVVRDFLCGLPGYIAGDDDVAGKIAPISGVPFAPVGRRHLDGPPGPNDAGPMHESVQAINGITSSAAKIGNTDSGHISLDKVIRVRRLEFSGHVYNLSTIYGYFLCNGVYTGNTHRAWQGGVLAASQFYEPATGPGWWKTWDAENDDSTRPCHRRADGQRRRLRDTFQVCGEDLMYPGDPAGMAANVINCRCDMHITEAS